MVKMIQCITKLNNNTSKICCIFEHFVSSSVINARSTAVYSASIVNTIGRIPPEFDDTLQYFQQ